jgi:hypothetical protein
MNGSRGQAAGRREWRANGSPDFAGMTRQRAGMTKKVLDELPPLQKGAIHQVTFHTPLCIIDQRRKGTDQR